MFKLFLNDEDGCHPSFVQSYSLASASDDCHPHSNFHPHDPIIILVLKMKKMVELYIYTYIHMYILFILVYNDCLLPSLQLHFLSDETQFWSFPLHHQCFFRYHSNSFHGPPGIIHPADRPTPASWSCERSQWPRTSPVCWPSAGAKICSDRWTRTKNGNTVFFF